MDRTLRDIPWSGLAAQLARLAREYLARAGLYLAGLIASIGLMSVLTGRLILEIWIILAIALAMPVVVAVFEFGLGRGDAPEV